MKVWTTPPTNVLFKPIFHIITNYITYILHWFHWWNIIYTYTITLMLGFPNNKKIIDVKYRHKNLKLWIWQKPLFSYNLLLLQFLQLFEKNFKIYIKYIFLRCCWWRLHLEVSHNFCIAAILILHSENWTWSSADFRAVKDQKIASFYSQILQKKVCYDSHNVLWNYNAQQENCTATL